MNQLSRVLTIFLALGRPLAGQVAPTNLGFEDGPLHQPPTGWSFWPPQVYALTVVDSGAYEGLYAALLQPTNEDFVPDYGSMSQTLDATEYRGKLLRYRAHVRVELADSAAWVGLSLFVDRPYQQTGFADNMRERPIRSGEWRAYEIVGNVSEDATAVFIGVAVFGGGRVWVDNVSLEVTGPAPAPVPSSTEARAYLDSALSIMQQYHVNRENINWTAVRARAHDRAVGAQSPADTYEAIRGALRDLEEIRHSFFMPPERAAAWAEAGEAFADTNARLIDERYGYVRVPAFSGRDSSVTGAFARAMQNAIAEQDRAGACGWVVDLRSNTGGNMWPMLAGIGPVLGDGVAGAFVTPDDDRVTWSYVDGEARLGDTVQVEVPGVPYRLRRANVPVAVLTGPQTTSSGEVIAISFRGRLNSRSFGRATGGYSTANTGYTMPDSAMIVLTAAVDADRTGQIYGGPVWPDESVGERTADESDPVLDAALRWLASSRPCAAARQGR